VDVYRGGRGACREDQGQPVPAWHLRAHRVVNGEGTSASPTTTTKLTPAGGSSSNLYSQPVSEVNSYGINLQLRQEGHARAYGVGGDPERREGTRCGCSPSRRPPIGVPVLERERVWSPQRSSCWCSGRCKSSRSNSATVAAPAPRVTQERPIGTTSKEAHGAEAR
jgi:hypothetical protein